MNAGGALRGNGGNVGMSEGLFYRNLNNGEETPWLGESYKPNADFTQWTIKLRKGVEWSDGEAFTCKDVKFTLDTADGQRPRHAAVLLFQGMDQGGDAAPMTQRS